MTTQDETKTADMQENWRQTHATWTEGGDPSEKLAAEIRAMASNIRLLRAISSPPTQKYGELTAGFVTTMIAGCITKTMHDLMVSLEAREDLEVTAKAEIGAYLLTMVTLITASADGADRLCEGKDPSSTESFAITIRDLLRKQKADREAAAAAEEEADGGQ